MIVAQPMLVTVAAGTSVKIFTNSRNWQQPLSILCAPGAGGTCAVESSNDADAMTNGSAKFIDSGEGALSVDKEIIRYAPCVAIRLSATTQQATFRLMV